VDVTATFQLTERDFRRAVRNLPALRKIMLISVLVTLFGVVDLAFLDRSSWAMAVIGPALLLFLELVAVRLSARRSASILAHPWTARLTEGGYALRTGVSDAKVGWSAYREVTERSGFWYLHQTNRGVSFLPQQAFAEADRAQLAAFFAAKLPAQPRPWYRAIV
jgi:hypothetical protein